MKRVTFVLSLAAVVGLVAIATSFAAEGKAKRKKMGKDIVDTAVAAGNFKTLATALKAADLVETLKGKGPFTVFAPTDEAFAKLPKGTVEDLLKPENKKKLAGILTYHVVAGKVMAADVVKLTEATTVQGLQGLDQGQRWKGDRRCRERCEDRYRLLQRRHSRHRCRHPAQVRLPDTALRLVAAASRGRPLFVALWSFAQRDRPRGAGCRCEPRGLLKSGNIPLTYFSNDALHGSQHDQHQDPTSRPGHRAKPVGPDQFSMHARVKPARQPRVQRHLNQERGQPNDRQQRYSDRRQNASQARRHNNQQHRCRDRFDQHRWRYHESGSILVLVFVGGEFARGYPGHERIMDNLDEPDYAHHDKSGRGVRDYQDFDHGWHLARKDSISSSSSTRLRRPRIQRSGIA